VDLMKTKEEYIDALERMEQSYYNFDGCMSAMNRFKEDVNLLEGLVNEHFKEKVETNFEHYKDGIIELCSDDLAISKGKISNCNAISCTECIFVDKDGKCIGCNEIKKWLKKPYRKTVYKLTKFEIDLLQSCSQGYSPKYQFKNINSLTEMRKNGYFKCINRDETIEEILEKSEVVG